MIGDTNDMKARLLALLPLRWFADTTPMLSSVLHGLSDGWAWLYTMLQYVRSQTRIATATDSFLDLISQDFLGATLPRKSGEADSAFRARIQLAMFRPRATRPSLVAALTTLTGRAPVVFEPARPADSGAWGKMLSYNNLGGYGSLSHPFQVFVTAYRPFGVGLPFVGGYNSIPVHVSPGGYGQGAMEYAIQPIIPLQVTDADINNAIAASVPVAVTAWTRISN